MTSPATPSTAGRLSAPGFVGRERDLAELVDVLASSPAVVRIEGEAGIGKTRLVQEFLAAAAQPCLVATCLPFREPLTLGPVVDAVRQVTDDVHALELSGLAGALRPLFPEWADHLPPLPEPAEDATASRHRLFRALTELLAGLGVTLVVVEDAHWADDASLEFLLFLLSRDPQPVSLVVTYRPEDVPADSLLPRLTSRLPAGTAHARLELQPLAVGGTARLASSMLADEPMSDAFAAFLHEHTGGVPLAVEETVRLLYDRRDLTTRNGEWVRRHLDEIAVPPGIREAVLERAGRLGADAQLLLRAAAVLADPSDAATLVAVSGLDPARALAGLDEALGSGLMHEDGRARVALRHALAARAVYEATPGTERRAMHLRAGQVLEQRSPPPVARLAGHFQEAGDVGRWCEYAEQAADVALVAGDEATGSALLHEMIVDAALPPPTVARLMRKLRFAALAGDAGYRELAAALRTALDPGAAEPAEGAELHYQLGRVLNAMEEFEAGRAEMEQAVRGLEHASDLRVQAMLLLAWPRGVRDTVSTHRRWLDAAAEQLELVPPEDRLHFAVDRASVLLELGDEAGWAEAEQIPDEAPSAKHWPEITRAHANIGDGAMRWGRYAEARRRLAQSLELASAREYVRLRDGVQVIQAHLDWLTGAWDGLADRVRMHLADTDLHAVTRLEAVLIAGLLALATGDLAAAERDLLTAARRTREQGTVMYSMEPVGALARRYLDGGRLADALALTDEPIEILTHKDVWLWGTEIAPVRVRALLAGGRTGEAAELVAAFDRGLGGRDAPAPAAALALCRAVLAEDRDPAEAAPLYARAAEQWQALPRPYDALLARERQAACLLATGHRDDGVAVLAAAHDGLAELGARSDASRVAAGLRRNGAEPTRVWRGGRRGYGDQLSPRELDVARLLVGGRTNREIAEALFLSPKTVARHLDGAMRKLGVASRTALAVKVVEHGLVDAAAEH